MDLKFTIFDLLILEIEIFDGKAWNLIMTHPTLLERFKCESESENNKRRKIEVHSLGRSTSGVEGCVGAPGWGLGQVTNRSIIHMDLHKRNNKLVNV